MQTVKKPAPDQVYTDNELRYAAYARCQCGAGLAYVKNHDLREVNSWDCSDILTARAIPSGQPGSVVHDGPFPFFCYEIKSEDQPSANGATTRPT